MSSSESERSDGQSRVELLVDVVHHQGPEEVVARLEVEPNSVIADVLARANPALADEILWTFGDERRQAVLEAAPPSQRDQWSKNHGYPEDSVGRLMDAPIAVMTPELTVAQAVERLRQVVKKKLVTYGWVVDAEGKLVGVIVFRELLFASPEQKLSELMLERPFFLTPELSLTEAMRAAIQRHFPAYPVCDADGRLVGVVRGQTLFEQQAFELSAQAGTMVGVEKEERLATPWLRSLKFRHPWLQLNLLTAFIAAAVVGVFEDTLDQLVVLAVFLPVLAGQSGNTGCQALAVSLRGITLGEVGEGGAGRIVMKEALLGFLNGILVGITAGLGMYAYASMHGSESPHLLALTVMLAMIASCTVSGIAGSTIPMALRKAGADPATASSIFLTTATDVVSMGMFLSLANLLVL